MKQAFVAAPAKINLFLAITGRRTDGFHDLLSIVAPVEFGDTLTAELAESDGMFSLTCDDPSVPIDESNLVLKAAHAFAAAADWRGGATFTLKKRIPMGAGLGGGSSDAAATLRALNLLADRPLAAPALTEIAAGLGSDCALFMQGEPALMLGRGERVEPLTTEVAARVRGRSVLIFKPGFGIATPWAYRAMAAQPETYLRIDEAEQRLARWIGDDRATAEDILFNNMERVAFAKFPALPLLLETLRADFGLAPRMSGSGSACFALLPEGAPIAAIVRAVRTAWGESALVVETRFA